MQWLDEIPWYMVILMALTLGLAPFIPEPHVIDKLRMLFDGNLHKLIDIGDLLMHGSPWVLLILKIASLGMTKPS